MRTLLVVGVLGLLLATALFFGLRVWNSLAGVEMPWQGWLALVLGSVLTLALGIGLMSLVFYSARRGHDEAHRRQEDFREGDSPSARDDDKAPPEA